MGFPIDNNKGSRIMIVDDECSSAELLASILKAAGYPICITVTDPSLAVERFRQINPDLVLLDLHMEPMNGVEVLLRITDLVSPANRPPVLMITADPSPAAKHQALEAGATDFLSKPLDCVEVTLRIEQLLRTHALHRQCQYYSMRLETLVDERTAELQKQTRDLEMTIAELKQTQQQVIQQERLRALGTIASGIAHDLNNGLSLILGHGDILLEDNELFPDGSPQRRHLQEIVRAGRDNAAMVARLRGFYRPNAIPEERELFQLNGLIEEVIASTAPKWQTLANAKGITIHVAKDLRPVPQILGSPSEIREVFTNLIFNAVDAMPDGGRIIFHTHIEKGRVVVQVADSGTGMNGDTQRRCFEPFFTTKGEDGSGLGLAMSHGIIRRHGGTIGFRSAPRQGTKFTITLPIPKEKRIRSYIYPADPIKHLSLLLVEDHPGIREIVSAYLAHDEHTVKTAANGREALAKFHDERFDIVITDRAMPELNGSELAAAIKRINPDEPVIMLTGFGDELEESLADLRGVDLLLHKPTCLEGLRKAIHKVRDGAHRGHS
jgi:signal transduction histidine kinase